MKESTSMSLKRELIPYYLAKSNFRPVVLLKSNFVFQRAERCYKELFCKFSLTLLDFRNHSDAQNFFSFIFF
jgi:hypothetical protein